MTDQAPLLEKIQSFHAPQRPFFERFGYLGTCVLPVEVLDSTPLKDPETDELLPSLRQICNVYGRLCFAHVLYSFAEGLYWADVAATADLAGAERVVLTEAHLTYALAWDERLYWQEPVQIRRLMFAQARTLKPLCPCAELRPAEPLFPAPEIPLVEQSSMEVSTQELREALAPTSTHAGGHQQRHRWKRPSPLSVQQGLLRAMLCTLQRQVAHVQDEITAQTLQAQCVILEYMQHWQRQTHQCVVSVRGWCEKHHSVVWQLIVGVPESLLEAAPSWEVQA